MVVESVVAPDIGAEVGLSKRQAGPAFSKLIFASVTVDFFETAKKFAHL